MARNNKTHSFKFVNSSGRRKLHIAAATTAIVFFSLVLYTYSANFQPVVATTVTYYDNQAEEPTIVHNDINNNIIAMEKMDVSPERLEAEGTSLFPGRLVHLDLKGAPPKISYFKEIFPVMKTLGATGILIEYEDMFPYKGSLSRIAAKNAYSVKDIQKINKLAKDSGLDIIPLVQTFGHLEFILKLETDKHLREVPQYAEVICPSKNETLPLIFEVLKQIKTLHPDSSRIHIGSDEVYYIGKCSQCQDRLTQLQWMNSDLFIDHVTRVARFVKNELKLQPVMWDDEFRAVPESNLKEWGVGNLVEIVVWQYSTSVSERITDFIMNKYFSVFQGIWVGSAFKGATGPDQILTNVDHHLANHLSWMNLLERYRNNPHFFKLKGIMMTGWQRYDHFSVLCDLLPVGFPSLTANLLLVSGFSNRNNVIENAKQILKCRDSFSASALKDCVFPGAEILAAVQRFGQVREEYEQLKQNPVIKGWMSKYNVKHQFSSPGHVDRIGNQIFRIKSDIEDSLEKCKRAMNEVFDTHTVNEWTETFVTPVQSSLEEILQAREILLEKSSWPRRPLDL